MLGRLSTARARARAARLVPGALQAGGLGGKRKERSGSGDGVNIRLGVTGREVKAEWAVAGAEPLPWSLSSSP